MTHDKVDARAKINIRRVKVCKVKPAQEMHKQKMIDSDFLKRNLFSDGDCNFIEKGNFSLYEQKMDLKYK